MSVYIIYKENVDNENTMEFDIMMKWCFIYIYKCDVREFVWCYILYFIFLRWRIVFHYYMHSLVGTTLVWWSYGDNDNFLIKFSESERDVSALQELCKKHATYT